MKRNVFDQLKNKTAKQLIDALERDGWERKLKRGAIQSFKNTSTGQILTIHYHPNKTYGPKLLKHLMAKTGWSEEDLRRLKLIK